MQIRQIYHGILVHYSQVFVVLFSVQKLVVINVMCTCKKELRKFQCWYFPTTYFIIEIYDCLIISYYCLAFPALNIK